MKNPYFSILFLSISNICFSQNLVLNGDFETHSACPDNYNEIDYATNWSVPTTSSSSDYYNVCGTYSGVTVPYSGGGYQQPHSGDGYAGIYVMYPIDIREYIETALTDPLSAGSCYHVEMYVNASNLSRYSTDAMGFSFSVDEVTDLPLGIVLDLPVQVENTAGNFPDTSGWLLVSGEFTAQGGEKYLVIGNFKSDENSPIININPDAFASAYTFIDDVVVSPCTGINDNPIHGEINLYPDPFDEELNFSVNSEQPATITLYNIAGQKVAEQNFMHAASIETSSLPAGIYVFEITNGSGLLKTGKVVKQ